MAEAIRNGKALAEPIERHQKSCTEGLAAQTPWRRHRRPLLLAAGVR